MEKSLKGNNVFGEIDKTLCFKRVEAKHLH